jgi:glycosyltransferase involved in cell wall biosynthesis
VKILHITEALGGGVAHSISQLARIQSADGFDVMVAHSIRPDTPGPEALAQLFPAPIQRRIIPMVTAVSPLADAGSIIKISRLLREIEPHVVHLHSSKAGALGRMAAMLAGQGRRTFYSPRGFSFLRQDVSPAKRLLYLFFEATAARLGGTLIACSDSEGKLARQKVRHPNVVVVDNAVGVESIPPAQGSAGNKMRIVTSGRVCYPKAPWHFRELARALKDEAVEFVWIGAGELEQELAFPAHERTNLTITGWLDRKSVIRELGRSDIYVQTSLWEGMPLSLIEAQVAGLPAVVSDAPGCRDIVVDGVTGYVCEGVAEMQEKILRLVHDRELRARMGTKARALALGRFSSARMHREMMRTYFGNRESLA